MAWSRRRCRGVVVATVTVAFGIVLATLNVIDCVDPS